MSTSEQTEEIKEIGICKDEEPPALDPDVKQSEEDDFLQLEIQRHGIIQANWKHWQTVTKIKLNLSLKSSYFSIIVSALKIIFKFGLLVLRLVTFKFKCYKMSSYI